jgi:hypothetical protein
MMISGACILIETDKFPVLEGEEEELVNEGMYGKSLCLYLEKELPKLGIDVPSFCCEDWGWWVDVKTNALEMGLCVYSDSELGTNPTRYAIMSSITEGKKWVWSKFRKIDVSLDVIGIMDTVEKVFRDDREITKVSRHDDFPL